MTEVDHDRVAEILHELREYFDNRADAEYFTDSPTPRGNVEMDMLVLVDNALGYFKKPTMAKDIEMMNENEAERANYK